MKTFRLRRKPVRKNSIAKSLRLRNQIYIKSKKKNLRETIHTRQETVGVTKKKTMRKIRSSATVRA